MNTFALQKIEEIVGRLEVFKLTVNGECEYDSFEKEIEAEGSYLSELTTIQVRLQEMAELKSLPDTKFKDITPEKEKVKEYEVKTKNLRVYLFHDVPNGRVIICAGKKTSQKKDIKHFREVKKRYLESKK
jgi:putative component of toxin-antitoxin plasmid stabilization module